MCPRGNSFLSLRPTQENTSILLSIPSRGGRGQSPRREGDEFLGGGGVDGHALVQVRLRAAHLEHGRKALQHLVAAHADHMDAHYLLAGEEGHKLHRRLGLLLGRECPGTVPKIDEGARVDLDLLLSVLRDGLRLGKTHCGREGAT